MDPVSITSACVGVTSGITQLLLRINSFVRDVRRARKDIDAIARELISLQLSLEALRDERQTAALPDNLRRQIMEVLVNCQRVVNQIENKLLKVQIDRLGRSIRWSLTDKNEINLLRSSLESNKSALNITLSTGVISMLASNSSPFQAQRRDIRQSTDELNRIELIRAELTDLNEQMALLRSSGARNTATIVQMMQSSQAHVTQILEPLSQQLQRAQDDTDSTMSARFSQTTLVDSGLTTLEQNSLSQICPRCGFNLAAPPQSLCNRDEANLNNREAFSSNESRRVEVPLRSLASRIPNAQDEQPKQQKEVPEERRARLLCHFDITYARGYQWPMASMAWVKFLNDKAYPLQTLLDPNQRFQLEFHIYPSSSTSTLKRELLQSISTLGAFKFSNLSSECFLLIRQNKLLPDSERVWAGKPLRVSLLMIPIYATKYKTTGYDYVHEGSSNELVTIETPDISWEMPVKYRVQKMTKTRGANQVKYLDQF